MIYKIETHFETCTDGYAREFPPDRYELMDKINELVEAVNKLYELIQPKGGELQS